MPIVMHTSKLTINKEGQKCVFLITKTSLASLFQSSYPQKLTKYKENLNFLCLDFKMCKLHLLCGNVQISLYNQSLKVMIRASSLCAFLCQQAESWRHTAPMYEPVDSQFYSLVCCEHYFRCCVWDLFETFARIFESPIHPLWSIYLNTIKPQRLCDEL